MRDINNNKRKSEVSTDGPTETNHLRSSPKDLAEDMCSAIQQNPQVVASAVNELSRQMVQSHHAYQNLDVSFNDFLRAYKDPGKGQGSMLRSLADIRKASTRLMASTGSPWES